jgi:hypothetical protein
MEHVKPSTPNSAEVNWASAWRETRSNVPIMRDFIFLNEFLLKSFLLTCRDIIHNFDQTQGDKYHPSERIEISRKKVINASTTVKKMPVTIDLNIQGEIDA